MKHQRLLLLGILVGVVLVLGFISMQIVFPRRIPISEFHSEWGKKKSLAEYGIVYQDIFFRYKENSPRLSGWFIPGNKKTAVVVVEGWGQNRNKALKYSAMFHELGYPVLTFDFRGQGASDWAPTTFGWHEAYDIAAAVQYLKNNGYKKIVLFGVSMGGFSCLRMQELFAEPAIDRIIVDSAYHSYPEMLEDWFSYHYHMPSSLTAVITGTTGLFMGVNPWAITLHHPKRITVPVLLIHGARDYEVTRRQAEENQKQLPKVTLIILDAVHAESYAADPTTYRQHIKDFMI